MSSTSSCIKPSAAAAAAKTKPLFSFSSSSSSTRGFSATARAAASSSSSSRSLLDVLDTEIKYEADHAPEGPPALPDGWAFGPPPPSAPTAARSDGSEATGSARLTLVSLHAPEGEKVTIDLLVDDQDDEEEDRYGDDEDDDEFGGDASNGDDGGARGRNNGGSDASVVFTVTVSKPSLSSSSSSPSSLVFDCRSDGTYLQVIHVSLENEGAGGGNEEDVNVDDDVASYSGPMFDELDEALQAEFESYLEDRGVVPSLGGVLAALAEDKEAREYAAWLGRVREFVAAA